MEIKQLQDVRSIGELKYSDQQLFFTVISCDIEKNTYPSDIYVLDLPTGKIHPLTNSHDVRSFEILSDQSLLFTRGDNNNTFYRLPKFGEATEFFTMDDRTIEKIYEVQKDLFLFIEVYDRRKILESVSDHHELFSVEETEEIPIYTNAKGYINGKRKRLGYYIPSTRKIQYLTDDMTNVSDVKVFDEVAYFSFEKHTHKRKLTSTIAKLYLDTMQYEIIDHGFRVDAFDLWNGELLTWKSDMKTHGLKEDARLYLGERLLTDTNFIYFYSFLSDLRYGEGQQWKIDGDKLYVHCIDENHSKIIALDRCGNDETIYETANVIDFFEVANRVLYFCETTNNHAQELYQWKDGVKTQLTSFNKTIDTAPMEEITFENDHISFCGFVIYPKNFDPSLKYPGILSVHGGPKACFGRNLMHEMQVLSEAGYFVFFTNPRGSDGRGDDFSDIRGKYGSCDFSDLMKFTEVVCEKIPQIDKIALIGGSYGGFMANWAITHTNRFACCCSQRSISNWISMMTVSDIGYYFVPDQVHADFFDYDTLWNNSPLKYAQAATTPTLFLHSDEDYRCPLSESIQMYTALKYHHVDTRLVVFHQENHELSRNGKPQHRVKRLEEILQWLDRYMR